MASSDEAPNIFTINTVGKKEGGKEGRLHLPSLRDVRRELKSLLARLVPVPAVAQQVAQQASQRLRSALDPVGEQQRRLQHQRQQLQSMLNDIDHQLIEVNRRLALVASSMCSFGETHDLDGDSRNTVLFLRDAAAFLKEAEPAERVEAKLTVLESMANRFRSLPDGFLEPDDASLEEPEEGETDEESAPQRRAALQTACADLRVDVAVLLESALMVGQQALALYKRLICRLQLLVCEYEPIYRQEISACQSSGESSEDGLVEKKWELPAFLPLDLGDGGSFGDAQSPAPEVRGALSYFQLANGGVLRELGGLVLELDRRARRVRSCSSELRTMLLREAAA